MRVRVHACEFEFGRLLVSVGYPTWNQVLPLQAVVAHTFGNGARIYNSDPATLDEFEKLLASVGPTGGLVVIPGLAQAWYPGDAKVAGGITLAALEKYPELRIVASTHNVLVPDQLRPEHVLCTTRKNGMFWAKYLSEHPEAIRAKFMSTAKFWSDVGESWVFE